MAYLRDSGGSDQEDSVNRQEEELRRWCAQYSLELTAIYSDEARTARHSLHKRKDLLSMMSHLRDGGDEAGVIIWNYERFFRNIKHGRAFIAEIEQMNKVLCSLTDHMPEGSERYIMQDLKLWSAEQTSVKISIDVTSGMRRMVETHGGMPGTPPRGFRRGEPIVIGKHRNGDPRIVHRWEPDPELVHVVRVAFQMRAAGASLKQIMDATKLYASINSYCTFFSNRLYMGELHFGDFVIPGYCEAIVDAITWDAANLISQQRNRIKPGTEHPRRMGSRFLLSGIVHCQYCGSVMNGHVVHKSATNHHEYYACARKTRRRDCPSWQIPRLEFEQAITDQVIEQFLRIDNLLAFQHKLVEAYKQQRDQVNERRVGLSRNLTAIKKRISNLTDTLAELGASKSIYETLRTAELEEVEIKLEIEKIEKGLSPTPTHTSVTLKQVADQVEDILRNGTDEQRRQYLHGYITRIIARRDESGIHAAAWCVLPQSMPPLFVRSGAPAEAQFIDIINLSLPLPLKRKRSAKSPAS